MILIYDNGHDYSDHRILFVDCGDFDAETATSVVRLSENGRGHAIAFAASFEWREGGALDLTDLDFWPIDDETDLSYLTTRALAFVADRVAGDEDAANAIAMERARRCT